MRSKTDWRGYGTLTLWTLLCVGCMAVMMWWAAGKSIVIADTTPDGREDYTPAEESVERYRLTLAEEEGKPGHFTVPVSPSVHAEQISIENRYTERQLWIYIQGAQAAEYRDYPIAGDIAPVVGGWAQQQEDMTILKLQMNTIQEYSSVMEENRLYVEYMSPQESFERIVVIDPCCGGEDVGVAANRSREKDITLQIARAVRQQLEGSEIKVYLTRQEDVDVSPEDRILLAREVGADLYAAVGLNGDAQDRERFGTEVWYNGDYFLPGFGNLQLADLLERQVTEAVSGRANGLIQADDPVLQRLTVPGALVKAGYLTHEREGELLGRQEYVDKVAAGITAALRQAFKEMENSGS